MVLGLLAVSATTEAAPALPFWVQVFAAIGPTLVATTVAYVAWQQWKTNHAKLRSEVFQQRIAVYQATQNLIGSAAIHGSIYRADYDTFAKAIIGYQFWFSSDTRDYCERIRDMALEAAQLKSQQQNDDNLNLAPRLELIDEERKLLDAIREQGKWLDLKFRPYLDLTEI